MNKEHHGCATWIQILRNPVFVLTLVMVPLTHAAIVWNGPVIIYSQPAPDPTQATNQDRITPDVWLTRAASKGLFNAYYETNATAFSPEAQIRSAASCTIAKGVCVGSNGPIHVVVSSSY